MADIAKILITKTRSEFFSGERFKNHEIDHRFGCQFRISCVSVVIRNVLEVENVNLKLC